VSFELLSEKMSCAKLLHAEEREPATGMVTYK